MSRTGSHPDLITQNPHSMGSIFYLKCEKDSVDFTSNMSIEVVSDYTHLITSSDRLLNQSVNIY